MKIIAISSVKNEADILPQTVDHLTRQGVDKFIISNGGGTGCVYKMAKVRGIAQSGPFDQGAEMSKLAYMARDAGADWVIPFDADEYWIDPLGGTIRSVLEALPSDCLKVHCAVFKHADWDHKYVSQNPMGKVCFRPTDSMTVAWGNHDVTLDRAGTEEHGLLEIRELQYRDYDHFVSKVNKARELFASWDVPVQHGYHMRVLAETPDADLPAAWETQLRGAGEMVYDPIPAT